MDHGRASHRHISQLCLFLPETSDRTLVPVLRNVGYRLPHRYPLPSNSTFQTPAFLNFAPWAVFVCHHLFQCPPWHCMGSFRSSGLNMGVSPCKSISLQGTCSKFDLACYCTVAYAVNRLLLFEPLSESDNSLSALEVQGLEF
ncbi:hypothetical protein Tco_0244570 [Tanacetum coccineum]